MRKTAPGETGILDARQRLLPGRQAVQIKLHDVRAGPHGLEVILAVLVGDHISAVFEHDAGVGHALEFAPRRGAIAIEYAPDDGEAAAEQRFTDAHRHPGRVRYQGAGVGARARGVHGFAGLHTGAELHHVAHPRHGAGRDIADIERQRAAIFALGRVGGRLLIDSQ